MWCLTRIWINGFLCRNSTPFLRQFSSRRGWLLPLSFSVFFFCLFFFLLSLSEIFETLQRPIDFGSSDLGSWNMVPFDAVLLWCFDEVLGDVEVIRWWLNDSIDMCLYNIYTQVHRGFSHVAVSLIDFRQHVRWFWFFLPFGEWFSGGGFPISSSSFAFPSLRFCWWWLSSSSFVCGIRLSPAILACSR